MKIQFQEILKLPELQELRDPVLRRLLVVRKNS
jgi:hypothetical protein